MARGLASEVRRQAQVGDRLEDKADRQGERVPAEALGTEDPGEHDAEREGREACGDRPRRQSPGVVHHGGAAQLECRRGLRRSDRIPAGFIDVFGCGHPDPTVVGRDGEGTLAG